MRESYTRTTLYLEIQHGLLDTKDAWESRTDDMNQIEIIRKIREKLSQKGHNSHAKKQPTQETQGSTMPPPPTTPNKTASSTIGEAIKASVVLHATHCVFYSSDCFCRPWFSHGSIQKFGNNCKVLAQVRHSCRWHF